MDWNWAPVAASVVDTLAAGGRRYGHGRLVRARLGSDFERLTLPDGAAAEVAAGGRFVLDGAG